MYTSEWLGTQNGHTGGDSIPSDSKCEEIEMNGRIFTGAAAVACSVNLTVALAFSQSAAPAGKPQSPEWFLFTPPSGAGGGGNVGFNACVDDVVKYCTGLTAGPARSCLKQNSTKLSGGCTAELAAPIDPQPTPNCVKSPVCGNPTDRATGRSQKARLMWKPTMGYTYAYPFTDLPPAGGGVSAVDIDSKGNLWAFQRNAGGKPQLFKFDPNHKLILSVGEDVLTHQYKAHGIKIDRDDNVWICDANGSTIKKISPEGKLLMTLGIRGERGDWDEAKGQRLIWQPVMLDFASNGDIYIFEGHANESPNDVDASPTNTIGAARVIHLDKNGKFINQWYGNSVGQGKFAQTHGSAVDPRNGDVWIGDREEFRIVVYDANGKFIKTIQMRNLVCALFFDKQGQLWMGSGQDGQFLKLDRDGNVVGAIGEGFGYGPGQFIEASYMAMDSQGNLYAGDTSVGRITKMLAPKK